MATSPITYGTTAPAAGTVANSSTNSSSDPQATKEQFISLLVAQLQNQDPLDPTDGTQFLSQLTEINSLEQLLEIRSDLDQISSQTRPASGSGAGTGSGSSSGSSGTSASASSQTSGASGS